ncbi:MAG: phenylalanine--tRNA ligase subunit beta [Bacteroidia bacterium]|nr:phenylalanine--tRNA ligase subunit beta [Bacteroidia bacterium]
MRISWQWLQELIPLLDSPESFAEKLTRAGIEVESLFPYKRLPPISDKIVVGQIIDIQPHPNAQKLLITKVIVGTGPALTIVTGARNINIADKVPVALPGAQVYKEGRWTSIETRSFRGVLSEGMLCSEAELSLGSDADGILQLPLEAILGTPISSVLDDYEDLLLEVSVTPNRGDALSHLGLAREYAALTGVSLTLPEWTVTGEREPCPFQIDVPDLEGCPRYGGIYIEGIQPGVPSPSWLRYRLEALGVRSIHPVVDITNYILIGYGQPLHAFDADKLQGRRLRVGPLQHPMEMRGLGGQSLALEEGDLVIADEAGPACLAGLLGGERTAISPQTQRVFIESAYFSPKWIRRTGRRLKLQTESGYRFMRGTDPAYVPWAAEAAAALIQRIYPTATASQYTEVHDSARTAPRRFALYPSQVRRMTGLALSDEAIRHTLHRLEIQTRPISEDVWEVSVPLYRLDVQRPVDIAEEILRIEGWESLEEKEQPPAPYPQFSEADSRYELRHLISEMLTGMGLWEIRTNSLVGKAHILLNSSGKPIRLANPLYEELAYLRTSLLGSGVEVILHNRNHGALGLWAFEWGRVYHQEGEKERLGFWGWGRFPCQPIIQKVSPLEYLSAVVRALLARIGITSEERVIPSEPPWREGIALYAGEKFIGQVGHLSESFLKSFHLKGELIAAAELDFEVLVELSRGLPSFPGLSYHPIVVKDLSLYIPPGLTYAQIVKALWSWGHPYLQRIEPFDRYQDKEGKLSYGLRFYLQSDHTLSEEEIHAFLREAIALVETLGASVRKAETFQARLK